MQKHDQQCNNDLQTPGKGFSLAFLALVGGEPVKFDFDQRCDSNLSEEDIERL